MIGKGAQKLGRLLIESSLSRSGHAPKVKTSLLKQQMRLAMRELQVPHFDVALLLCGDAKMRALNKELRGIDKTTDVLSWNYNDCVCTF